MAANAPRRRRPSRTRARRPSRPSGVAALAPDFEAPVLRNASDAPEWDAKFPDHPLSRCRSHLREALAELTLSDEARASAPFTGPAG